MATKPVILTLDDEPEVLQAIELDLRKEYGARYRILRADSGAKALDALEKLKLRNEPVALLLVDQRMPHMTGVEFLENALEIFPDAKRVLLTAYADTDAAIQAINKVKVDYYLLKPWEPPEENLYPILHDLLEDWLASFQPAFEGVRVVGFRWSPKSHYVREFLARTHIPYQWLDAETSEEALRLMELAHAAPAALPLLVFPDGAALLDPSMTDIAQKVGMKTQAEQPFYDLAIIGAGPAGLAAAVYGASEGLRTVLIERNAPGGQAGMSSRIENYLGFPSGLSGGDLARRAVTQAKRFGVELLCPQEATQISLTPPYHVVTLADGTQISARAVLIATGVSYRRLEIPDIDKFTGAGVYYGAAMTEGIFCQNEDVYVIGGANSAGQAAMYFSRFARYVMMLVRAESLAESMSQYLIDQIAATPTIKVLPRTEVAAVHGDDHLEAITIVNRATQETQTVPAKSLFIFIGTKPYTEWVQGLVQCNENGFILTGLDLIRDGKRPPRFNRDPFLLESSVPGIFVAGDVRANSIKRVASSVGEGAMCVQFIHQYLREV